MLAGYEGRYGYEGLHIESSARRVIVAEPGPGGRPVGRLCPRRHDPVRRGIITVHGAHAAPPPQARPGGAGEKRNAGRFLPRGSRGDVGHHSEEVPHLRQDRSGAAHERHAGAPIAPLEKSIKASNWALSNAGYTKLVDSCNSCHTAAQHAFIKITAPTQNP